MDTDSPRSPRFDRSRLPKITPGEEQLYGDRAPLIRLLGTAAAEVSTARDWAAVCLEETRTFEDAAVTQEWKEHVAHVTRDFEALVLLERHLASTLRQLAAEAVAEQEAWYQRNGVLVTNSDFSIGIGQANAGTGSP